MNGESFSISEALRFGWDAFKRNIAVSFALGCVTLAVMFLLNGAAQATQPHGVLSLGFTLATQLAQIVLGFLWVRLALAVYDGRPLALRELWPDAHAFFTYLAVSILFSMLVTAGLLLLVAPGIYLAVRYGLASFLAADERSTDIVSAFRQSSELTRGNRGRLFLFGLVILCIDVIGAMFFGLGLLVTLPMTAFAAALVYRRLSARVVVHDPWTAGPPAPMAV